MGTVSVHTGMGTRRGGTSSISIVKHSHDLLHTRLNQRIPLSLRSLARDALELLDRLPLTRNHHSPAG